MAAKLDLLRMHLHRQPNGNTKLDLRSPLSTAIILTPSVNMYFYIL